MSTIGILGVLCGGAVMITFFLSFYFIYERGKESVRFWWLGLIFLAIGLRLGKSIIYFILNDIAPFGLALGFFGLSMIGPLIWFHSRSEWKLKRRAIIFHSVIPISGSIFCFFITPSPLETFAYQVATFLLGVYLVISWGNHLKEIYENAELKAWNAKVLILVSGVWLSFVFQHLSGTMMSYALGSMIASFFVFWIFYQSLGTQLHVGKMKKLSISNDVLESIRRAIEHEELYKRSGLSLTEFSEELDIPPYIVTKSVKQLYDRTFPETLNYFRVEEIKSLLVDDQFKHLKIEALAYEVGFSSPSSFYAAFKKVTGVNPKDFQKSLGLMSA